MLIRIKKFELNDKKVLIQVKKFSLKPKSCLSCDPKDFLRHYFLSLVLLYKKDHLMEFFLLGPTTCLCFVGKCDFSPLNLTVLNHDKFILSFSQTVPFAVLCCFCLCYLRPTRLDSTLPEIRTQVLCTILRGVTGLHKPQTSRPHSQR